MRVTQRVVGDVVILDMEGKYMIGALSPEESVVELVNSRAGRHWLKVLVNLAGVAYFCTSTLVPELVRAYATLGRRGGTLKLLSPRPQAREVLKSTRLDTAFEIYYDEAEAIRSFA